MDTKIAKIALFLHEKQLWLQRIHDRVLQFLSEGNFHNSWGERAWMAREVILSIHLWAIKWCNKTLRMSCEEDRKIIICIFWCLFRKGVASEKKFTSMTRSKLKVMIMEPSLETFLLSFQDKKNLKSFLFDIPCIKNSFSWTPHARPLLLPALTNLRHILF